MRNISKPYKVLAIDDDEGDFFLIKDYLQDFGSEHYVIENVTNFDDGLKALKEAKHDIYLIDNLLGAGTGLELIEQAIKAGNKLPKILLTGIGNREVDINAIEAGADDYLPKELLSSEMLERTIRHAVERYEQRALNEEQFIQFRTLFEQSIDPIYITDENMLITQVNSSFLELFNLKHDEAVQKNLVELFKHKKEFNRFKTNNDEKGFIQNLSVQLIKSNGDKLDTLISSSPIYNFGKEKIGYQGIIHDITELKRAEYGLKIADQSSLTNRMARMVAHEVRNPLTNITLAVDQMKDSTDDYELYVDMIGRNSGRINTLINDLLNSTKIADLNFENHHIEDIINIAIEHTIDRIKLKEVKLTVPDINSKTLVIADKDTLAMVFTNIVTNAIEATDNSVAPHIDISLIPDDNCANVLIRDNGKGMDEETLENLFKPFFSKRQGGMGLGMATVQNIIYKHKGEVHVESEVGKGTTFIIAIPLAE